MRSFFGLTLVRGLGNHPLHLACFHFYVLLVLPFMHICFYHRFSSCSFGTNFIFQFTFLIPGRLMPYYPSRNYKVNYWIWYGAFLPAWYWLLPLKGIR